MIYLKATSIPLIGMYSFYVTVILPFSKKKLATMLSLLSFIFFATTSALAIQERGKCNCNQIVCRDVIDSSACCNLQVAPKGWEGSFPLWANSCFQLHSKIATLCPCAVTFTSTVTIPQRTLIVTRIQSQTT